MAIAVGSAPISIGEVIDIVLAGPANTDQTNHGEIVWSLRLPRICLAALVGLGLSVSGAALQGLFHNPLADPYVIGIASGGALGAALALTLMGSGIAVAGGVPVGAMIGALAAGFLVYRIALGASGLTTSGVLLAGLAVGLTCSAALSGVLIAAEEQAGNIVGWLMGNLGGNGWREVGWVGCCTLIGLVMLLPRIRDLDVLLLGEESAQAIGVDTARARLYILGSASILVAGAVAFCGLIGFVGIMVPHFTRMLLGARHRWLIPGSALFGAAFLIAADTAARVAWGDQEIPVGVITGCLGGPFFIFLLKGSLTRAPS
jgi:iron complex transport system permease protein